MKPMEMEANGLADVLAEGPLYDRYVDMREVEEVCRRALEMATAGLGAQLAAAVKRAEGAERERDTARMHAIAYKMDLDVELSEIASLRAALASEVQRREEAEAIVEGLRENNVLASRAAAAAERRLGEMREALSTHGFDVECEGIAAQSFRCRLCTVKVYAKRPGPRPEPFPHAVTCLLASPAQAAAPRDRLQADLDAAREALALVLDDYDASEQRYITSSALQAARAALGKP